MLRYWRTGNHWGRSLIREGVADPDLEGRRADDELVGLALTEQDAEFIVLCVNGYLRRLDTDA